MFSNRSKQIVGATFSLALTVTILGNVARSDVPDYGQASHVQATVNTASLSVETVAYPAAVAKLLYKAAKAYTKWYKKNKPLDYIAQASGTLGLQTLD
jgi:hypothetical protein